MKVAYLIVQAALVLLFDVPSYAAERLHPLQRLDGPLSHPFLLDVRWSEDGAALYLATGRGGVIRYELGSGRTQENVVGSSLFAMTVATANQRLFASSVMNQLEWRDRARQTDSREQFASISDLDASSDHVVVFGSRRNSYGNVWFGTVGGDRIGWRQALRGDLATIYNCFPLGLGAARFLPGGRFVVAPVQGPGLLLFDEYGRAIRSWNVSDREFLAHCAVTEEQTDPLAYPQGRAAWLNQRRVLDDLVALDDGFGAIVRFRKGNETHWELLRYRFRSKRPEVIPIPLTTSLPYVRLKADTHGRRIVFVMSDHAAGPRAPAMPGRVLIAELRR